MHDFSKLMPIEAKEFSKVSYMLKHVEFGTHEYNKMVNNIDLSVIDHHRSINRHHPEHFNNGMRGMTIVDLIEAFCDWQAASHRNKNGNKIQSLKHCAMKFNLSKDLYKILRNSL